jgi:predicted GIY-YIG superfamily endonuclease
MAVNNILYKVENKINGQVYIGATTNSLHQRKLDHEERANRNEENKFHKAISTYGADTFKWEQIDTAYNNDELAQKEKAYIIQYDSKIKGYNADAGGGIKKTVYQYSIKDGSLIQKFDCLENAANAINSSKQHISRACLSVNNTYGGFYWGYENKIPFKPNKDVRKKRVLFHNLKEQSVQQFNSVAEASKNTGISKSCIARFCRGERKPPEDYEWRYL